MSEDFTELYIIKNYTITLNIMLLAFQWLGSKGSNKILTTMVIHRPQMGGHFESAHLIPHQNLWPLQVVSTVKVITHSVKYGRFNVSDTTGKCRTKLSDARSPPSRTRNDKSNRSWYTPK
jgi:hypothetical protein